MGIKISGPLRNMEIGQTIAFPMEKILSVRSAASGFSMALDRKYMVRSDRIQGQ